MWNPFRLIREKFARATAGGIVDGVNMFAGEDADFVVEVRVRKLPAITFPEPELEAIEESPKARGKGAK